MTAPPKPTATRPMDGLLAALRLGLQLGDGRDDARACAGIADWAAVARLATGHRVRPLLLKGLASAAGRAPESGLEGRLRNLAVAPRIRGLRQLAALAEISERLAAGGIDSIVLKGLPLSQQLHGNPLLRESIDIDLLVSPERFEEAAAILLETGWRRVGPDFGETPRRKQWYDRLVHDCPFIGPGGIVVELHRRLLENPYLFNAPFGRLWQEGRTQTAGEHAYRVLGDGHLLFYLAFHGAAHGWHRLKWLCDIAALLAAADEQWLARSSARCPRGLATALGSALCLCGQALHTAPPAALLKLASDGARARLIARFARRKWAGEHTRQHLRGWRRVLVALADSSARFTLKTDTGYMLFELASLLVAPRDFDRLKLPDRWLWLAPILRPAIWIAKALAGRRAHGAAANSERGRSA